MNVLDGRAAPHPGLRRLCRQPVAVPIQPTAGAQRLRKGGQRVSLVVDAVGEAVPEHLELAVAEGPAGRRGSCR
jgi:hypothetical protein